MIRSSTDLAIARVPGAGPGAPEAIDVRCARLALSWDPRRPLCCAAGAAVDLRSRLVLERAGVSLPWSDAPPAIDGRAPSGVIVSLGERAASEARVCGALAGDDPVRGEGCAIRAHDPALLLDDCALFPLDLVGGTLVPSSRIPLDALAPSAGPCLWDDARARAATRFGESFAAQVDEIVRGLRARGGGKLHLRTLR